jgi:glycosyltransferase involved in cell wall biosynthesis
MTRRLRIVHFGYEDVRRPGSGGGGARTFEVNRRLAERHDITVITARYPGCKPRIDEGVRYRQVGLNGGYRRSVLSYFAALPLAAHRARADLIIEDFGAPLSTVALPLWTRTPVIGLVNWLFAGDKSRQYKLPFFVFEAVGVRAHRTLIAASDEVARRLRESNRRADVRVVAPGFDPAVLTLHPPKEPLVTFLGRLEFRGKGVDMLIPAWAAVAAKTDARFVIAGDGVDEVKARRQVAEHGLSSRVEFLGRVEAAQKFDLLARSQVVCMPSRYEAFGMVAMEALACGTPVLAFDLPPLRSFIPIESGLLVPSFDEVAYADALLGLIHDPQRCQRLGTEGRTWTRGYEWDAIAEAQEAVYLEVVEAHQAGKTLRTAAP